MDQTTPPSPTELREFVARLKQHHDKLGRNGKTRARKASVELIRIAQEVEQADEVKAAEDFWDHDATKPGDDPETDDESEEG